MCRRESRHSSSRRPVARSRIRVTVAGDRVESVTFVNQPAYQLEVVEIDEPSGAGSVPIAYGGQWYAFVNARDFGLSIELERAPDLVGMAQTRVPRSRAQLTRPDPRTGFPPLVENLMWVDEPKVAGADGLNMAVNAAGAFDRSPCGTGTSARLAVLSSAGELRPGESYVNSGVLGTVYRGTIAASTEVRGTAAIVPEITGRAWLTGRAELWASDDDPLADGVLLGPVGAKSGSPPDGTRSAQTRTCCPLGWSTWGAVKRPRASTADRPRTICVHAVGGSTEALPCGSHGRRYYLTLRIARSLRGVRIPVHDVVIVGGGLIGSADGDGARRARGQRVCPGEGSHRVRAVGPIGRGRQSAGRCWNAGSGSMPPRVLGRMGDLHRPMGLRDRPQCTRVAHRRRG